MTFSNLPGNLPGGTPTADSSKPVTFVPAGDVATADGQGNFPFAPGGGGNGGSSEGEGAALWVYGHSFTQSPGVACTAGLEQFNRIKSRRQFAAVTTYRVGNSRVADNVDDVMGQAGQTPKTGSTWDGTRKGAVLLDLMSNDATNALPAAQSSINPLTANIEKNFGDSLTTLLAVLTSSGRVEAESGTKGGTWLANVSGAQYSGGALAVTESQGATLAVPVTVPAAGFVWLILETISTATVADFTVTEGGTTYATVPGSSRPADATWSKRATAASRIVYTTPIKITATPGAHTFVITKTDASATAPLYADCFLLPSAAPVPIVLMRDPLYTFTGVTQAVRDQFAANKAILDPIMTAVVAGFPTVTIADANLQAIDQGPDGLHPNDRGMRKEADAALASAWLMSDISGLYTTL